MFRRMALVMFFMMFRSMIFFAPATADNSTVVYHYNQRSEVQMWVENPCMVPSEWILMTGTEHLEFSYIPGDDRFQDHWRLSQNLEGIGPVTGTEYKLRGAYNELQIQEPDSSHVVVNARSFVITKGSAPNFQLKFHYRFEVRDGQLILDEVSQTTECTGQ